jgi:hypothetical protein
MTTATITYTEDRTLPYRQLNKADSSGVRKELGELF